jgi:Phosphoinositide phospholipase C, Ca2+-dependent
MTRRWLGALGILGMVASLLVAAPAGAAPKKNPYPLDGVLRVNDVQVLGTHNSYHLRPDREMQPADASNYAHPPLDQQLDSGIRSLEIDVQNDPDFAVYHSIIVDQSSNCPTFAACLDTIARWSRANPGHVPITVFVELKEIPTNGNASLQQIIDDFVRQNELAPWDAAALDRLDAVVRGAFGKQLITPDEVRGKHSTLRSAIMSAGWPTLAKTRGRVMVIFNSALQRPTYLAGKPSLQGRPMFVIATNAAQPSAAFVSVAMPDAARITKLLDQNMMIRTLADADGVEARANDLTRATNAIQSGAQVVATDYPVADPTVGPYLVELPGSAVARCDPVTAPRRCRDTDVENARGLARG